MNLNLQKKALAIIQEKKRKADEEYRKKLAPLYENEKYIELEKVYTKLVIENAKNEVYLEASKKEEENKLKAQLEKIKAQCNLENTQPNYSCQICKDEGYKNGEMCQCLKKEISKILLKESGFEKLENFEESSKTSGELGQVYQLMKKWCASNFKKNMVYLAGPTGVGKTHLIRCMANDLIERGKVVKLVTAYALNQDFKDFSKTYDDEILRKYVDVEVLFIDDIGTEPIYKNVTLENLYLVINERKTRKLPTIITSNLTMEDLRNRYDERIFSRIADRDSSITLFIDGNDRRITSNK